MTDAGYNDSVITYSKTYAHLFFAIVDVGLTSSIGAAFLFDGLVDLGVLKDGSFVTLGSYFTCVVGIFSAWTYALLFHE